mmetsp:Transcript_3982/g.11309  ORF Transcript_3982/g.11309 Transcript_3982/m.11309 type:complete len:89 (+) Transcript_3982:804-1070(+)
MHAERSKSCSSTRVSLQTPTGSTPGTTSTTIGVDSFGTLHLNAIFNAMRYNSIPFHSIQFNSIQFHSFGLVVMLVVVTHDDDLCRTAP